MTVISVMRVFPNEVCPYNSVEVDEKFQAGRSMYVLPLRFGVPFQIKNVRDT